MKAVEVERDYDCKLHVAVIPVFYDSWAHRLAERSVQT